MADFDTVKAFLDALNLSELAASVVVSGLAGIGLWYRKKFGEWSSAVSRITAGLKIIPELQDDLKGIRHYVSPNGGGSLMDSAKRTEAAVGRLQEQVDFVVQTIFAENDTDETTGRYHCDADGSVIYVNQTLARWLLVGKTDLMGWNMLNFIHSADVERVRNHWDQCREEHRQYRIQYHMVATTGQQILVSVVASPTPDNPPAKRWIAVVRRVALDE